MTQEITCPSECAAEHPAQEHAESMEITEPEQSEADQEFERQLALPLRERHEKGYPIFEAEKIEFLFGVAMKAEKLMEDIAPQIGPILDGVSKNPMLKMFLR